MRVRPEQIDPLIQYLDNWRDCPDLEVRRVNIDGRISIASLAKKRLVYIEPDGRERRA